MVSVIIDICDMGHLLRSFSCLGIILQYDNGIDKIRLFEVLYLNKKLEQMFSKTACLWLMAYYIIDKTIHLVTAC